MVELTVVSNHSWFTLRNKIVRMEKTSTRQTVIANIKMLMDLSNESQHSLAKRLGWKQSTLSNLLSGRHNIAIERAEAIAEAYGLEGWHLLLRDLPKDLSYSKTVSKLFEAYKSSTDEGRDHISAVAERESAYAKGGK